ncbi:MAG TPA: alpha/beta fold hydrolase [Allosphingosinicella sp.]|uniref:alpha/beta hydrolase n=1 Tax=Allosphingosinicella sp. TaxID=2823234 RepID=UPI002EDB7C75
MLLKLIIGLFLLYVAVAAALYFSQTSIFFPTRMVPPAGPLPSGSERIELTAPDGIRLEGLLIPASAPDSTGTVLLGFAGNASNAAAIAAFLHQLYPAHPVVAFHYRGYRPSAGSPSAAALVQDAPLLFDLVRERLQPKRVVVVGISIGSGVAAGLAAARSVDGLILVTPFDSLKAVARDKFPWLPTSLLLRPDLPAVDDLRGQDVPVSIVAAERDDVIPPRRTEALRRAAPNLVHSAIIKGRRHNDIAADPLFYLEMRRGLGAVLSQKPSS